MYKDDPDGDGDDNRGSKGSDYDKEDEENQFRKGASQLEKKASSPEIDFLGSSQHFQSKHCFKGRRTD